MTDIVLTLKDHYAAKDIDAWMSCLDAAEEIEQLKAEIEQLKAALREIAKVTYGWEPGVWTEEEGRKYFAARFFGAQKVARLALEGK